MPVITELQVFYRLKDGSLEQMSQAPTDQATAAIKLDVGRMVAQIRENKKAEYYYVVVKVQKSDGTPGYRTIVPKTLI